jgi:iron complex outermembrane receptor protein
MTLSGRFNRAQVKNTFLFSSSSAEDGDFTYTRFNPAVGLNYSPNKNLTSYISYTEGMRAPTPVELSCADPSNPCALPNAFASDPFLKKVVSRTVEMGLRGKLGDGVSWSLGLYQTRLQDDILFIGKATGTNGYFDNVGDTQRRGIELSLDQKRNKWDWGINYALVDATFESGFTEQVSANSQSSSGIETVSPGSHMPGIPRHLLKLRMRYSPTPSWTIGGSMVAQTSTYARGDENNQDSHGQVPGFAVFNLDMKYAYSSSWEYSLHIRNLFNRDYSTFGNLADNNLPNHAFNSGPNPEQFRSYAAPFSAWINLTYWFDKPKGRAEGAGDRD